VKTLKQLAEEILVHHSADPDTRRPVTVEQVIRAHADEHAELSAAVESGELDEETAEAILVESISINLDRGLL
jgi:hypothetical protein